MKKYKAEFRLNVIEFTCIGWAKSKKQFKEDILFNLNLRSLKTIHRMEITQIPA